MKKFGPKPLRTCLLLLTAGIVVSLSSCGSKAGGGDDDEDAKVVSQTPVTVTSVSDSTLVDYIDLSATSTTLQKNYVKSNTNGYIQLANAHLGGNVSKGEV